MHHVRLTTGLLMLGLTVSLAGCAASSSDEVSPTQASAEETVGSEAGTWPRTVTVNGDDVVLTDEPVRIVPMSWEVSDLALELAGPQRLAAVSDGSLSPSSGNHIDLAEQVDVVLPYITEPDPEQVLALDPDLVLLVARHGGEQAIVESLQSTGVPVAVFAGDDFANPEAVASSIEVIGELFGTEELATETADHLRSQVAEVAAQVAGVDEQPRVLALMARGDNVMEQSADSMLSVLTTMAGAVSVADEQGLAQTVPIDAEGLLAANPDVILVEDFRGTGLEPFRALLESEAVASVPAIAQDRIALIPMTIASSTSTTRTGDGLEAIVEILHPELSE